MCFSAGASFTASAVLSVAGVLSIQKAETRSQLLFAGIPFIFAIQQFTEGFVWLSLSDPIYALWQNFFVYFFLFFAHILWPVWVPLSVLLLEEKPKRKKALAVLTFTGAVVSLVLGYHLIKYHPGAQIVSCHIHYEVIYPMSNWILSGMFYFISTVTPLFISSTKRMWVFGIAVLVSYTITQLFYLEFVISVWCFFAAILSVIILYTIDRITQDSRLTKIQTV